MCKKLHECEDGIEKSVPRITVWKHKSCRVMKNGGLEGFIFLFYPHTNNEFFFMLTIALYFKISFKKLLNTLKCNIA